DVNGKNEEGYRWGCVGRGKWCIEGPAKIRSAAFHKESGCEHCKSKGQYPEAPVIHAWQCHVRGTNHHGYHPVCQAHECRHNRTEDHDQTMHGGHLIKEVGFD